MDEELDKLLKQSFYNEIPYFWNYAKRRLGGTKTKDLLSFLRSFYIQPWWQSRPLLEAAFSRAAGRRHVDYCEAKHGQMVLLEGWTAEQLETEWEKHRLVMTTLTDMMVSPNDMSFRVPVLVAQLGISEEQAMAMVQISVAVQTPMLLAKQWELRCEDDTSLVKMRGVVDTLLQRLEILEGRLA